MKKFLMTVCMATLVMGFANADCCDSKAPKGQVKAGWFTTASGANLNCCKGLPADSKECCKNKPGGKASCAGDCGGDCDKGKKEGAKAKCAEGGCKDSACKEGSCKDCNCK